MCVCVGPFLVLRQAYFVLLQNGHKGKTVRNKSMAVNIEQVTLEIRTLFTLFNVMGKRNGGGLAHVNGRRQ